MNIDRIYQTGDTPKFYVTINDEGANQNAYDFKVKLSWGLSKSSLTINKSDMLVDKGGRWFFKFPTSGVIGKVLAECTYTVHDDDFSKDAGSTDIGSVKGFREEVEISTLCYVTNRPYIPRYINDELAPSKVIYEPVGRNSVASQAMRQWALIEEIAYQSIWEVFGNLGVGIYLNAVDSFCLPVIYRPGLHGYDKMYLEYDGKIVAALPSYSSSGYNIQPNLHLTDYDYISENVAAAMESMVSVELSSSQYELLNFYLIGNVHLFS